MEVRRSELFWVDDQLRSEEGREEVKRDEPEKASRAFHLLASSALLVGLAEAIFSTVLKLSQKHLKKLRRVTRENYYGRL